MTDLKQIILSRLKTDTPEIIKIPKSKIYGLIDTALNLVNLFETMSQKKQPVFSDTDVVWVVSGPGAYSLKIPPYADKPDRYRQYRWSRGFDRQRVDAGIEVVREVTALRYNKKPKDVRRADIKGKGPSFLYHATTWETHHIKTAIDRKLIDLPIEKVILYDSFTDLLGKTRPIINTWDQVEALPFPDKLRPRRLVIVSHPAHLTRLMYFLSARDDLLSSDIKIQPYPVPTPKDGKEEYTIIEIMGILAYIYKYKKIKSNPLAFSL